MMISRRNFLAVAGAAAPAAAPRRSCRSDCLWWFFLFHQHRFFRCCFFRSICWL